MKFEELSSIWNSVDFELDNTVQVNKQLVKDLGLAKVKSSLSELKLSVIFQIVVGFMFINFIMDFFVQNLTHFQFSGPAFFLLAFTAAGLTVSIYQLWLSLSINAELSVVEAQKKLMRLQTIEVLDIYSLLIIIPLFYAPFMIVGAKAFFNFNLYELSSNWFIYQTIGSIVIAVIVVFALRKFPNKKLKESIDFLNELNEKVNKVPIVQ